MFNRVCKPLKSNSFFIFGARGTGKSTFVKKFLESNQTLYYDLLDDETFDQLMSSPNSVERMCENGKYDWIVIDEVQRLPKLLNVAHRMIEKHRQKFALTGSSARKLKRGGANLLAGRAFLNSMYPLTQTELGSAFDLNHVLRWGSLPKIYNLETDDEKKAYLRTYGLTYIREEIQIEQVVRKLEPFREFLTVAAQSSGKIINYAKIGKDVGAHIPTVQNYFQILSDTYIGFILPHYHKSVRKSQIESPKFYFFDNGVKKSLESSLDSIPVEGTYQFGDLFESFIVQEVFRLNDYLQKDFRLSFYRTKHGTEVDLVLSKAKSVTLVEIKSTKRVDEVDVRKLRRVADDFGPSTKAIYISCDTNEQVIDKVECLHWSNFLKDFNKL